ncbi:MAG TPA: FG-GAP repeat protein, partial [Candidatus Nanoarchaeia archaeon]|nr:FG-GAP repeat protein [Candidatus Nanoarchaeia archaeon]
KGSATLSGTIDLNSSPSTPHVYIQGAATNDRMGIRVLTGKVNNDSYADLFISSDGSYSGIAYAGKSDLIYGTADFFPASGGTTRDLQSSPANFEVGGAEEFDYAMHIALGDLNGDGLDDLLIGAPNASGTSNSRLNCGEVHVLLGPTFSGSRHLLDNPGDIVLLGKESGDVLGTSIVPGDYDGDSNVDLALAAFGAMGNNNAVQGAGEAYIVRGPFSTGTRDLSSSAPDVTIYGPVGSDSFQDPFEPRFPNFMAKGNFNSLDGSTGLDGLVLGMQKETASDRANAGVVRMLYGRTSWPSTINLDSDSVDIKVLGAEAESNFGYTFASGDFNADGFLDHIWGAPREDASTTAMDAGVVRLRLSPPMTAFTRPNPLVTNCWNYVVGLGVKTCWDPVDIAAAWNLRVFDLSDFSTPLRTYCCLSTTNDPLGNFWSHWDSDAAQNGSYAFLSSLAVQNAEGNLEEVSRGSACQANGNCEERTPTGTCDLTNCP